MADNRSRWPIIDRSHVQAFTCHRHCNDTINMKFGFQSEERMGYQLEVCRIIARKDMALE